MSAINKARNPAGEKGNAISAAEKKEIFDAFHALENKILAEKPLVDMNNIEQAKKFLANGGLMKTLKDKYTITEEALKELNG